MKHAESDNRSLELNDRIWIHFGDGPSDFEERLATVIDSFSFTNSNEPIYYVSIYSVCTNSDNIDFLIKSLPKIESRVESCIAFWKNDENLSFKLPHQQYSFAASNGTQEHQINITAHEYKIPPQNLMVFFCRETNSQKIDTGRSALFDMIGFMALLMGRALISDEVISGHFALNARNLLDQNLRSLRTILK